MRANSIATRKRDAQLNANNRKAHKLVCLLREQGKSFSSIARELNENGYKTSTGKQWQTIQVQRLISLYRPEGKDGEVSLVDKFCNFSRK